MDKMFTEENIGNALKGGKVAIFIGPSTVRSPSPRPAPPPNLPPAPRSAGRAADRRQLSQRGGNRGRSAQAGQTSKKDRYEECTSELNHSGKAELAGKSGRKVTKADR